ncbi:MAG TPA: cupin domain-containing protein [Solirubrobacteraceae bacterium]|jgi:quercetin dioxygenase-like cupin family protein|nr:cupin domain-containing protein [Solirubrobacteraceae bacterium]
MSETWRVPRRVVTGHDADGRSVVLSDGEIPQYRILEQEGAAFFEIWSTDATPAPILPAEPSEPTQRTLRVPPEPGGTKIRINEFQPGHLVPGTTRQTPMHRTETIDYGIVLDGEMVLILDDGAEVELAPGDVVVQRGTDHAWANRSDAVARMAFILIDATFSRELLELLPADAVERLMSHGPDEGER